MSIPGFCRQAGRGIKCPNTRDDSMGSTQGFVDYVMEQFAEDCGVTKRMMFGEFGLFSEGKMFGMVCDDRLLVKPTAGGRAYIGDVVEAAPYPGAKLIFLIDDHLEDGEWLSELVRITTRELPAAKAKKAKKRKL